MALALRDDLPTGLLHKLIVEDVAPQISSRVSKEFIGYAAGMRALADARPQSRKEADEMMLESAPVCLSFLKEASGTDNLSPLPPCPTSHAGPSRTRIPPHKPDKRRTGYPAAVAHTSLSNRGVDARGDRQLSSQRGKRGSIQG